MKKSLLLSTALLVGVGAFAQTNRMMLKAKLYPKIRPAVNADGTQGASTQRTNGVNSVQTSTLFSNSRNGFGTLVEETNPLHYNEDLNMVAFTQRCPTLASWPLTGITSNTAAASGYIVTRYSTDNGATWGGVNYYQDNIHWGRYPSGVIANAPNNTDPAQANFVAMGPSTGNGTGWFANFFASVPANATGNVTTNDQQGLEIGLQNASTFSYFASYNSIANGRTVWTAAYKNDGGTDLTQNVRGVAVIKGTPGATASDPYTWTQDSVTFGPFHVMADGRPAATAPKIAFAPDGVTGYVLVNGVLDGATGENAKALQPNIWKTTDAGATWAPMNTNYNWRANHPEILCNLVPTLHDEDWGPANEAYPAFFDGHGSGITVDNAGVLHYVTTVVPAYSSHPDSSFFIYGQYGFTYTQFDDLDKPWIYDFTTTGNGTWDQKIIGKLYTRNIEDDDDVPDPAAWTTDGTAPMDYSNRIRVSRSDDGSKVLYTWTDSDSSQIVSGSPNTYHANTFPNLNIKGYDVTSGTFSATKEMAGGDAFEGGYYNHYTSTIAMPTGSGYRVPAVYIVSQDGNLNATNATDYYYVSDLEVDNSEYGLTIASNMPLVDPSVCSVGLKENAGNSIAGVSQNFPNPFNATSVVKVNLNKAGQITLNVMNSVGQVVATQTVKGTAGSNELTIDAANLSNGVYFYSVVAGDSKVTRKMTIVK